MLQKANLHQVVGTIIQCLLLLRNEIREMLIPVVLETQQFSESVLQCAMWLTQDWETIFQGPVFGDEKPKFKPSHGQLKRQLSEQINRGNMASHSLKTSF